MLLAPTRPDNNTESACQLQEVWHTVCQRRKSSPGSFWLTLPEVSKELRLNSPVLRKVLLFMNPPLSNSTHSLQLDRLQRSHCIQSQCNCMHHSPCRHPSFHLQCHVMSQSGHHSVGTRLSPDSKLETSPILTQNHYNEHLALY